MTDPTVAAPNRPPRVPIEPASAYILVVEDNIQNFVLIARLMAFLGVKQCQWKASGWQVLEFADSMPRVDLILMDINLPEIDGYEVTARLKQLPGLSRIPIIAVTANVMKGDREKTLAAGCDVYIQKPIDIDLLPGQIERFLKKD